MTDDVTNVADPRVLSPETLSFLATLLGGVQLSAGLADFDAQAATISKARRELIGASDASRPPSELVDADAAQGE